jgi:phosphoesterase RecJ-like protein
MRKLKINKESHLMKQQAEDAAILALMEQMRHLNKIMSKSKLAVIVGHKDPDGDAFGSALAFKHYLRSRYPKMEAAVVMPNTDLANSFSYLPGWNDTIDYKKQSEEAEAKIAQADLIVCLDFNNWNRLGRKSPIIDALKRTASKEGTQLIRIDHHEEPDTAAGAPEDSLIHADFAIVKPERPSTCEILAELFSKMDASAEFYHGMSKSEGGDDNAATSGAVDHITMDCATCLYNGIMTDTINFTTRHPSAKTFYLAAYLISKGADNEWLYDKAYHEKPAEVYRLQAAVEASTETDGDAAWYMADQGMLQRYHYHNGYLEGMPDKALAIAGIELSLGVREEKPGMFKVGIRSPRKYDCVKIAQALDANGGGHVYAASGTIYTNKKEEVEQAIRNILNHRCNFIL